LPFSQGSPTVLHSSSKSCGSGAVHPIKLAAGQLNEGEEGAGGGVGVGGVGVGTGTGGKSTVSIA